MNTDQALVIADGYNSNVKVGVSSPEHEAISCLAAEVRRLREDVAMLVDQRNEHIKGSADATTQCIEYQHLMAELRKENERLKENPPQSLSSWQPIATAQNDRPYIVGWIDDDGTERHDFDIMDDDVWRMHDNICEMAETCAPAGGITPNRTAPYTHYIELSPLPEPAP